MILLYLYFLFTFGFLFYEIFVYGVQPILKNKSLLPLTLVNTFITYPLSLYLTDTYLLKNITHTYSYIQESMIFLIAINLFDIYVCLTHYLQHKYLYRFHKEHHRSIDTTVLISYHISIVDLIINIMIPMHIIPNLLQFSAFGYIFFISYNIFFGLHGHLPHLHFHSYHHKNPGYNFSTGYPLTFFLGDRLLGTHKNNY
jgi:sterol desaturase/sphingolipid hydroxylase (fatty acid hydroxylase superfamily)